jgi:DNA-binding LacI/PurR family transcriptional regulator
MEKFAELSGVSRPTVSKYFNDPASVRQSTRARIEEALERYEYTPNIYAINQNRRLTKTIGVVVPYLADPYFAEIARNIETRCIDAGFSPSLFSSHGRQGLEIEILATLRSMKPAGVLLAPLGRSSNYAVVEQFCRDVPTVLFDSNIDNVGNIFVGSDNPQFTSLMVEYLCRTGEPPLFLEMEAPPNPNARKRHAGYVAAMERLGHTPRAVQIPGEGWALEEVGHLGGIELIEKEDLRGKTVLCSNDRLAIGVLAACYQKNLRVGISTNSDLRVAGLDGHPFSSFTCPPLTTVTHDYEAISERTVEELFRLMERDSPQGDREEKLFEGKLLMRESA